MVVPSRQRAHAARLAFAAALLREGVRVWQTPDVLTADAWLLRAVEELASASGVRVPRVLSPAEDWLSWRQCTAEATQGLDLLNRGALAESLRRAGTLAVEFGIDVSSLALAGAEAELIGEIQRAVEERCRALGAVSSGSLVGELPTHSLSGVTCAGFLQLPPRLQALRGQHRPAGSLSARPRVVIAADDADELGVIAEWCRRQIAMQADTRLLEPMLTQTQERYGQLMAEHYVDGGFRSNAGITAAGTRGVTVYTPIPDRQPSQRNPYPPEEVLPSDSPQVAEWKQRMVTPDAKAKYQQRAATVEWANALLRQRGLQRLLVRGIHKARAVLLWFVLAHNLMQTIALRQARQVVPA